jgi:hypothetical protein
MNNLLIQLFGCSILVLKFIWFVQSVIFVYGIPSSEEDCDKLKYWADLFNPILLLNTSSRALCMFSSI